MTSRNLVRLASRSITATAPAIPSSSSSSSGASGALSLLRTEGCTLRATSPPPSASIVSAACWEPRTLRRDGEDWEEVVVAAGDANAPDALQLHEETEGHGVVFGVPPTDDEVCAAVAIIKQ